MVTTTGQKKLNRNDVRKGTIRFIMSFIVLTAFSFLSIFFFFKSAQLQNKETLKEHEAYIELQRRNNMLEMQMDTIKSRMSLIGEGVVANDIALREVIFDQMNECKGLIGKDSTGSLRHYSILLENLEPMLNFKAQLANLKDEQRDLQRRLELCGVQSAKASTQMKKMAQPKLKGIYKNQN